MLQHTVCCHIDTNPCVSRYLIKKRLKLVTVTVILFVILFVFDKSGHIVTLTCAYPAKYDLPAAADVRDAQERDRLQ